MSNVDMQLRIGASPSRIWEVVRDIASYPHYMEDVRDVVVTGDPDSSAKISAWSVSLRGSILEWTEADWFDHGKFRIDFKQIDGDLEKFEGYWEIRPIDGDPEASEVVFYVDFEIGIPLLASMLNPVAEASLRNNATRMLTALESRVRQTV